MTDIRMFNIDALDLVELKRLRDACNRRILEMRPTRGLNLPELLHLLDEVKSALNDQGKEWHSLESWQWMDGEIRFWLNPKEQDLYRPGWFSINDLIAWSHEHGPVLIEEFDEEEEDAGWQEGVKIMWQRQDQKSSAATDDESVIIQPL